ncbi:unnamed protein product [Ranitomeya imitator]|uniref:Uncharacterized protein n=1 Tax=Ranitomeya imitator TaxID=111125 RepID=A0ABN9M7G5_9NEOB|nr:unnamed protein product [Ranitomeya imitator]
MMAANMDWYDRMQLDVPFMISVCKRQVPLRMLCENMEEKKVLEDVKKTVEICDRQTDEGTEGRKWQLALKKRVPFADQLQFILTSRNLRRTEGNVRAETPPVHEDNSLEHGDGEEVEDYPMCSSPNPPLPRQSSSMHAAIMSPTCTVASSSSAVDAAVVSSAVVVASSAASCSFVGGSRPTRLGVWFCPSRANG